jgi:predicted nucleic acid-binding protein
MKKLRPLLAALRLVMSLALESGCSAYDCEYVALARLLSVPLVTEDRQLLAAVADIARPLGQE